MTGADISAKRWSVFNDLKNKFIQSNKHIMKGCDEPSQLISFFEASNEIIIHLDIFNDEYTDKFISGKLKDYSNGFIEKFKPVLLQYLNTIEADKAEFVFVFKQNLSLMNKYVTVSITG